MNKVLKAILLWWTFIFIFVFIAVVDSCSVDLLFVGTLMSAMFIYFCTLFLTEEDVEKYSGLKALNKFFHVNKNDL